MSTPSSKSSSWFARLGSALGRKSRRVSSGHKRRGLRFESLETRSLLSATVLPSISGVVYEDPTGAGITSNDTRLPNITVNLFRDGGDGVFGGKNAGSDDTLVGTASSNANGQYTFNNLTTGTYFVQEVGVPGLSISSGQSVQTVNITSADLQGTTGTMIDSFSSTSQYVSASVHGGKTGTSSQSTSDAIGGHRNLYVQLTSAGGGISLGADSDFPGMLDFAANAASNGVFWVNWDGNNSNPAVLNPTGLGGVDITSQGANTGLELNVAGDHDNGFVMVKVYSDASDWSWTSVPIANTTDGSLNSSGSQFVAFSGFTVGGGMGANFSKVGAIQLAINGANANDGLVGPVEAVGPMVFSANFVNTAEADLAVVKTASPNPVTAGGQLTYTFTTTDNGPSDATGVTLSDTLPTGVQYLSSSGSQGTVTDNNGTITAQLGGLASGAVATTNVVVTVNPSDSGSLTNTVTVTGDQPDPNLTNNTSTVTTPIAPSADLALVKTASPSPVKAGQQLTYTLTTTDNGPSNATGVTIVDTLPAGVSYFSASGQTSATIVGQTLTLNVGNLATGASSTITVVVVVASSATGSITNTATVSGNQPDPNLANNTSSVTVPISPQDNESSFPGLTITKTASPNPVSMGAALTYTLTVSNTSLTTDTDVTIADPLPAGFGYFYASGANSATLSGGTLTLKLGSLAAGGTDTITVVGDVTAAAASTITNTATVTDDQGDTATSTVVTSVYRPQGSKYYLLGR